MALIVIPRRVPWRRKPGSSARINFAHPLARGLVADIPILENFGSTVRNLANDALNGTFLGGTYLPTEAGLGLEFSANTHGISFNGKTEFRLTTWTQHVWFIPTQSPDAASISIIYSNDTNYLFTWDHTSSAFNSAVSWNSGTWKTAKITESISLNKPHLVSATLDSSALNVYLDGRFTASAAGGTPTLQSLFHIGNDATGTRSERFILLGFRNHNYAQSAEEVAEVYLNRYGIYLPRTQRIFIPSGGALSLSSAATLRDGDKLIATQQKTVSVDALIRAADLLIGTQQKSLSVDAILADADKLSTASRHEATLAAQLLDGDVSIAPAQKAGSISGLLRDSDRATGISSKAALITGLLLDGDLLTALGSQIETHLSAGVLSGADVLIAGVTTNRAVSGKAQDSDALTVASAIDRLSAALGIEPESMTSASTSARSIGALIVEGDVALAGILTGRLQPALLIDGDILIIASSTVAQADLAGRINLSGRYAPQVSLVGVYAPAINLKGRVH